MPPAPDALNPLAEALNAKLAEAAPETHAMLSPMGRRLYFPKGILAQSAEAKAQAHRFNATIGIATEGGEAMYLPSVAKYVSDIAPDDVFPYASAGGRARLRELWQEKQRKENPAQAAKTTGLPVVTSALTHGLALVGDLFVAPGDRIVLPDKLWGNYRLTYEVRYGAEIATFPLFDGEGFNVAAFRETLRREAATHEKLIVLLNFPNNPTGYMPTVAEHEAIAEALVDCARSGTRVVAVCDDAYFGLFYHLRGRSATESLFGRLAGEHKNLLAIRLDGATKELFVWGLRCGFFTVGPGDPGSAEVVNEVIDTKLRGAIRSGISNSPMLSQTLVERALSDPAMSAERDAKCEVLRERAERVDAVAREARFAESWDVYPFNSGYFMCVALRGVSAESTRRHLLEQHETGLIATSEHDLRVAFSCLEVDDVEPMFELVDRSVRALRG